MTREEFFKKAEQKYQVRFIDHGKSERKRLMQYIDNGSVIKDIDSVAKICEFADNFSMTLLLSHDINKQDFVFKRICLGILKCEFWDDIDDIAIRVADMHNNSYKDIDFFMSGSGAFYDEDHNKVADYNDSFLEFYLDVPCDHHEHPDERTYRILDEMGRDAERKKDITEIVEDCHKNGVELTDKQKEFISEFAGIKTEKLIIFDEVDYGYFNLYNFGGSFKTEAVYIGVYNREIRLFLSTDGRIYKENGLPWGLNAMEALHMMLK